MKLALPLTTTPSTMPELLPCPFCGGDDITFDHDAYGTWWIMCECGIEINGCLSRKHAFERWNTRSPAPSTEYHQ